MLNFRFFYDYITHKLTARTRHGVHSPFVYKLIDEVIYDRKPKIIYREVEQLRSALLHDERVISITDLGAGSQLNNNRKKQVKVLAANALKPAKLAQLIHRLANEFQPRNIIELGTCLGITTAYLAKAAPDARIITIEGCPQTAAVAGENLAKAEIDNVKLEVGNFDDILPGVLANEQHLDFFFIDGNHRKEATLNYFELALSKSSERTLMIFDDIYWSKGMKEAWATIKNHPQVTVTIDLFWIGLVFFRKGQEKENFKVKM